MVLLGSSNGAEGETRTLTLFPKPDFENSACSKP